MFFRHIYQIDNDINLLKNHVDDIGSVIFNSKLGIIPTDLLDDKEIKIVDDFETYTKTKVALSFHEDHIIIILSIPKFSNITFSQVVFEPIPNKENKSLYLKDNRILIDENKNVYVLNTSLALKDLKTLDDECIKSIVQYNKASCTLKEYKNTEIKEIKPGFILFKNVFENFTHNCNSAKHNLNISRTYIIRFENCNIFTENKTFYNDKLIVKEKIIQTNLLKEIKENKTFVELNLQDLYIKQIKYEDNFSDLNNTQKTNRIVNIAANGTTISILILLLILIPVFCKRKVQILQVSSEPQSNGGGVTITPSRIII